jgi:hypothetical protein
MYPICFIQVYMFIISFIRNVKHLYLKIEMTWSSYQVVTLITVLVTMDTHTHHQVGNYVYRGYPPIVW